MSAPFPPRESSIGGGTAQGGETMRKLIVGLLGLVLLVLVLVAAAIFIPSPLQKWAVERGASMATGRQVTIGEPSGCVPGRPSRSPRATSRSPMPTGAPRRSSRGWLRSTPSSTCSPTGARAASRSTGWWRSSRKPISRSTRMVGRNWDFGGESGRRCQCCEAWRSYANPALRARRRADLGRCGRLRRPLRQHEQAGGGDRAHHQAGRPRPAGQRSTAA